MLKTITNNSKQSLIYWDQNKNGSNFEVSIFNGNERALQPFYENFFQNLRDLIKLGEVKSNLIPLWNDNMDNQLNEVNEFLKKSIVDYTGINYWDEKKREENNVNDLTKNEIETRISFILNKFRGNCGEILTEAIIQYYPGVFGIIPNTYQPVNPHEDYEYMDASALNSSTKMPVGIQVKCWKEKKLDWGVFGKALIASRLNLQKFLEKPNPQIFAHEHFFEFNQIEFSKYPDQIIFSFTDPKENLFLRKTNRIIKFFGPKEIENLDIVRNDNWVLFNDIVTEIRKLSPQEK